MSRLFYIFETDSTTYVLPQLPKTGEISNIWPPSQLLMLHAVAKGVNLSKQIFRKPKHYASVGIGSGQTQTTKTVRGSDPEWNEIL